MRTWLQQVRYKCRDLNPSLLWLARHKSIEHNISTDEARMRDRWRTGAWHDYFLFSTVQQGGQVRWHSRNCIAETTGALAWLELCSRVDKQEKAMIMFILHGHSNMASHKPHGAISQARHIPVAAAGLMNSLFVPVIPFQHKTYRVTWSEHTHTQTWHQGWQGARDKIWCRSTSICRNALHAGAQSRNCSCIVLPNVCQQP